MPQDVSSFHTAIVIILYYPDGNEKANVRRLAAVCHGVIVDNSPRQTFDKTQLGMMHYIPLNANVGIAEAQNIGVKYILDHTEATHIVFLDQDSTVQESYAENIANAFDNIKRDFPNLAFLGPKKKNKGTGREYKSIIHKEKALSSHFILKREIISSGGCTTRKVLESVGPHDSRLFMDYVDFDWCWRAKRKGYICGLTPDVSILHMVGQKTIYIGGYTIIVSSPVRYYYQFRNYMWLLRKNYVPLQWKINKGLKHFAQFIYFPIFIKSGYECWKQMAKGFVAGLRQ